MNTNELLELLKDKDRGNQLYEFTKTALEKYSQSEKEAYNRCKVTTYLIKLLKYRKIYDPEKEKEYKQKSELVEVFISAALLHNLFFSYEKDYLLNNKEAKDWENLFIARKELTPLGKKYNIREDTLNALFELIESQLGVNAPMKILMPKPGPADDFATTIFISYEIIPD